MNVAEAEKVLAGLATATIHEAMGRRGALPSEIKPVWPEMRLGGRAVTVQSPPFDNLRIHQALYEARPGDILVVNVGGGYEAGYWGEILSVAAATRELGGLVIDGRVRDAAQLQRIGFPVFSRGLCIRGTGKDATAPAWINEPVTIGDARIAPGDLIVGDCDGVVVVPSADLVAVAQASLAREDKEAVILHRLRAGETSLSIYGFDATSS